MTPTGQMALGLHTKKPGAEFIGEPGELVLRSEPGASMTAYERLLGDAIDGDKTLFASADGVEAAWAIVDRVLRDHPPARSYEPGTWGPVEAVNRLAGTHVPWHDPAP